MSALPIWVQYVQAFSIPALAVVAAIITYRQWRTAHNALRLSLFDRRFDVYVDALSFIGNVSREGYPRNEHYGPFLRARDRAQFLFGSEVEACLRELQDTAADLGASYHSFQRSSGNARQEAGQRNNELFAKFTEFDAKLTRLMKPYLGFSAIRSR